MRKSYYKTDFVEEQDYRVQWNIYRKISKIIKINRKDKILDAGCGYGELSLYLKSENLYGFDDSKKALEIAKKRPYKKLFLREIHNTKFKDKEFGISISIQVFPYIEKQNAAFKELLRITKKQIVLSVPNFNWLKIKALFSRGFKKEYIKELKDYSNTTNSALLKKFAKNSDVEVKMYYFSNKFGFIRNLLGNWLASEVVGVYNIK